MAKFRLVNGMRGNWYWRDEEEKRCRMCGREEKTWEHVWERCLSWGVEKGDVGDSSGERRRGGEMVERLKKNKRRGMVRRGKGEGGR